VFQLVGDQRPPAVATTVTLGAADRIAVGGGKRAASAASPSVLPAQAVGVPTPRRGPPGTPGCEV